MRKAIRNMRKHFVYLMEIEGTETSNGARVCTIGHSNSPEIRRAEIEMLLNIAPEGTAYYAVLVASAVIIGPPLPELFKVHLVAYREFANHDVLEDVFLTKLADHTLAKKSRKWFLLPAQQRVAVEQKLGGRRQDTRPELSLATLKSMVARGSLSSKDLHTAQDHIWENLG